MKKLTEDERRRIVLHEKVAPPIRVPRRLESYKGQIEFDLEKLCAARRAPRADDELPSDKVENIRPMSGLDAIAHIERLGEQVAAAAHNNN
jgi:hypothetical protein